VTRILAIGTGPLFAPDVRVFNAQALRTWQFTRPLIDHGHQVDLVVLAVEGVPLTSDPNKPALTTVVRDNFSYQLFQTTDPVIITAELQRLLDANPYDCVIAINNNAAAIACRLHTVLPIWADLNGYIMGEAQSRGRVYSSDEYLLHFWQREAIALNRADRFSTCSFKQMYATLGELGTVGRLNRFTCDHPFVNVVPVAVYEEFLDPKSFPAPNTYRGMRFPADAFAVLWSGGFNTWTDVDSLAGALSLAMEQVPRMHFVATGGAIPGHDERTYDQFVQTLHETGFGDRCHLLGWVEAREIFALYKDCDIGINVDALNYEAVFGTRNRLTNMMGAGLTTLSTLGTELTEIIEENKLGYVVPIGDVQAFADALVRAAHHPIERAGMARRALEFCRSNYTYETTMRQVLRWVEAPRLAPDNEEKLFRFPEVTDLASVAINPLQEHGLRTDPERIAGLEQSHADLTAIRSKPFFRFFKKLKSYWS
jgi:glycosyltransferase involved in cell wall biosynthesis